MHMLMPPARKLPIRKPAADAVTIPEIEAALLAPYPVLSSSQFCLELMTQGMAMDLRQAADLLSRDPGAVLRIFSAVGREFPNPADRPERLNDCIMSLGNSELVAALHTPASIRREQVALIPFARRAHLISRYAVVVAASLGLDQHGAQVVGLLHEVHRLPAALGRGSLPREQNTARDLGSAIAKLHQLPLQIAGAICAVVGGEPGSVWVALIEAAQDLATAAGDLRDA